MRILFVNRVLTGECIGRVPLGILYLSSALKQAGHQTSLIDAGSESRVRNHVDEWQPDVLAYSVRTGYHRGYVRLNRDLKKQYPNLFSIFGGNHPTFYPQMILKNEEIDAVCIGEAEEALVEIVDQLEAKNDYHLTQNFWVRREGEVYRNSQRRLIEPLDGITFPDRTLLDPYPRVRDFPVRNFITTRGCPYECTYCFNYAYFNNIYKGLGKRVRRRTAEDVVTEIEQEQRSHPFQTVQFEDDIFVYDKKWISNFADLYSRVIGKPFTCNVRVEIIDDDRAEILKRAGCASVWLGVEAGNEAVRKDLLGRSNDDDATFRGVRALQKAGIHVATENILGVPTTGIDHDFATLKLNQQLRPTYANPSVFQPYPQTPLGDVARQEGVFSGDFDDIPDFYEGSCLKINHLREVQNLQYLFPLAVRFRWINPLLRPLVKMPFGGLYKKVSLFWKGYVLTRRIVPVSMRPKHLFHVVRRAMTVSDVLEF